MRWLTQGEVEEPQNFSSQGTDVITECLLQSEPQVQWLHY